MYEEQNDVTYNFCLHLTDPTLQLLGATTGVVIKNTLLINLTST